MASYVIKGKVKLIKETEKVSDKFTKREFVLTEEEGQYPQDIIFQCTQDRVSLLNDVKEGSEVEVRFNLRGREWINPQGEAKYFNSMDCWALDVLSNIPDSIKKDEGEDPLPF